MKQLRRCHAGLTLIECAIATAIVAMVVGTALPGFQDLLQRRQLEGVASQLETDLQLARSEAVARNEAVRVSFLTMAGGSCYVMHTGARNACKCDAAGASVCTQGASTIRVVSLGTELSVQIRSNSASLLFDPVKGTVSPTGTMRVQSPAGSIHQVINVMGRVRSCTPDKALSGYRRC